MSTTPRSLTERRKQLNLKAYLAELSALVQRNVTPDELTTAQKVDDLKQIGLANFAGQPTAVVELPFEALTHPRFKAYVESLSLACSSPVYVWTPRTLDCGALLLPSLKAVHFDFDFTINQEGILTFATEDMTNRLLLDFSEGDDRARRVTSETQGACWYTVPY